MSASSVWALSNYGSPWYFFERQLMWATFGLVAFVITARVDYRRWQRFAPTVLVTTVGLLMLVLVAGSRVNASRRWLGAGSFGVQPSELAKLALVLCGAQMLATRARRLYEWRAWRPLVVVVGVLAALVVQEPDLTSTMVIMLIGLALLVVAGVPRTALAKMSAYATGLALMLAYVAPYRRVRILGFLHPSADPANATYQIRQSLIAIGSGGLDGVGLGAGRAKWLFLPNAHTDFIFAIVAEELGFVGCLLVLGLFAGLALVGLRVARRAPDRYGMLVAAGITAWIVGEAVINIGAVIGVLPVSGVPLPFLSVGGSSLVVTMAGAGILANIARQSPVRARRS
jgi:cell division protein FtsW